VVQICNFVQTKQLDHTPPQPGRGIKRSFVIFRQIGSPRPPLAGFHLATVRACDNSSQITSQARLLAAQWIDLDFQFLRHKLPNNARSTAGRIAACGKPYWWMGALSLNPSSYPTMLTAAAVNKDASANEDDDGIARPQSIYQQFRAPARD
jgi:hypothetical protein